MAFDEVLFPETISYGATGGPKFKTNIFVTAGGFEQRNINWSESRGEWDIAHGLKTHDQYRQLMAFFRARQGRARGFRFKDWSDFQAYFRSAGTPAPPTGIRFAFSDVPENLQDGRTNFQLTKWYPDDVDDPAASVRYIRRIAKPIVATIKLWKNGALLTNPGDFTISSTTGIVTFSVAPGAGDNLRWDGEFHVPCRFDEDHLAGEYEFFERLNWSVKVVEIRVV